MNKKQTTIITILVLCAIVLGMLVSHRLYVRWDLTRNKAYTLAKVSRELYKEIPEQVTITYYISDKLKSIHPIPGEIIDILKEYVTTSKGKIRLVVQDPVKAGTVMAAERLGVQPQQIQTVEQDQASVATVYTGIVIEYLDKTEVLPVVFSTETLEYDITSRIRMLVREKERKIGILIGDPDKSYSRDFPDLNTALTQAGYTIQQIFKGEEIPVTLSVLFVFGGVENFDDWDLYRIDYFIQSGGKVLFAVDGVYVDYQTGLTARLWEDKGLLRMLANYGVVIEPQLALDKACLILPYQTMSMSGGVQVRLARYPYWITVLDKNGNHDNPITANFSGVDLFWSSPLTLQAPSTVKAEVLFTTTENGWKMTKDFVVNPEMDFLFTAEADQTKGTIPLAAALAGVFPSYFKEKSKPVREGSTIQLPNLPSEGKESRMVVIGDSDLATTLVQYTRSSQNLDFLIQTADWLSNDDDILSIRNRAPQSGRLDAIADPDERARAALFAQIINVVIIPLIVIVVAIVRIVRRQAGSKKKEATNVVSA